MAYEKYVAATDPGLLFMFRSPSLIKTRTYDTLNCGYHRGTIYFILETHRTNWSERNMAANKRHAVEHYWPTARNGDNFCHRYRLCS